MSAIYIGVMTGTSMDGVDIVASSFDRFNTTCHTDCAF